MLIARPFFIIYIYTFGGLYILIVLFNLLYLVHTINLKLVYFSCFFALFFVLYVSLSTFQYFRCTIGSLHSPQALKIRINFPNFIFDPRLPLVIRINKFIIKTIHIIWYFINIRLKFTVDMIVDTLM
jgi:hypothetical protein